MIFHKTKIAKDFKFTFENDFEEINFKSFDNTIISHVIVELFDIF